MELFTYLRDRYPQIKLRGLLRAQDIIEEIGGEFCKEQATSGRLKSLGFSFDMVVADRFRDCIAIEEKIQVGMGYEKPDINHHLVTISKPGI